MAVPNPAASLELLTVLHLHWEKDAVGTARPRPFSALSYRLSGEADYEFAGQSLHVGAGQLLLVPRGVPYQITHGRSELIVVHYNTDAEPGGLLRLCPPTAQLRYPAVFSEMLQEWERGGTGSAYRVLSLLASLLAALEQERETASFPAAGARLQETVAYLRRHFTDPTLSVAALAAHCGFSETYFRRIFEQATGVPPLRYLQELRISHAKELLESGYCTVGEAAERSGFSDPKYFSRLMRRTCGKTPSELRRGL